MSEPVTLAEVKRDLRIEADDTSEDILLEGWIPVARRLAEIRTERAIDELGDDLVIFCQAVRLMIGSWHLDREGVGEAIPPGAAGMLFTIKSLANL